MEYAEFSDLTRQTISGLLDRIPAKYHEGLQSLLIGGELRLAVDQLMKGLERLQIPVTPAERDDLARMLAYLKEPASRLDGLLIASEADSDS
jgi:hypothetical protein